jgi:hypothetical protein
LLIVWLNSFPLVTRLLLTNSMECSPSSEANSHSASQETPHLLWSPKVHYHVQKNLPLYPFSSQMNPLHNLMPYFQFNIVPPSTLRFPSSLFPSCYMTGMLHAILKSSMTCSSHLP